MKKIKTFSHPTLGDIRTMTDERGEPWFVGKDVAERLGYSNTRDAVRKHVDEEDKTTVAICDDGSNYKSMTVLINESGLYSLILSSKLPQAKEFKRWVTAEVLPQIRRTGGYIPTHDQCGRTMTDDEVLARAQEIVSSTLAQKDSLISYQQAQLEAQRPKVVFYDAVAASNTTCSVAELAKMLKADGVDVGQNRLFEWFRNNGYLCTKGGAFYNTPYQHWVDAGLFRIQTQHYEKPDGECVVSYTTRVTGKGVQHFVDGFLSGRFII